MWSIKQRVMDYEIGLENLAPFKITRAENAGIEAAKLFGLFLSSLSQVKMIFRLPNSPTQKNPWQGD
jgi:hypothetical protein